MSYNNEYSSNNNDEYSSTVCASSHLLSQQSYLQALWTYHHSIDTPLSMSITTSSKLLYLTVLSAGSPRWSQ
jgi:hypothetical protein